MSKAAKELRIEELSQKAQKELRASSWFEAERLAMRALELAHRSRSYAEMASAVLLLQEARRQRMQVAIDADTLRIVESPVPEDPQVEIGCYLLQPPQVGSDARRLRLTALHREVPVLVLCREPTTRMGLVPLVAIGPVTVRARIDPFPKKSGVTMEWYLEACRQLGQAAIDSFDSGLEWHRQVDSVMGMLDAVPDHEELHQLLHDVCTRAAAAGARAIDLAERDPLDDELDELDGGATSTDADDEDDKDN
ncbi:MAG: hypothetical protein O2800_02695 [Planctomycetota bacterium]|nr:hypothetical protein [Planctomycetota bacterium]